jgi:hypothetical protein
VIDKSRSATYLAVFKKILIINLMIQKQNEFLNSPLVNNLSVILAFAGNQLKVELDDKFIQLLSAKLVELNDAEPNREQVFQATLNLAAEIVSHTPNTRDDKFVAALQEFKNSLYDEKTGTIQNIKDVLKLAINLNKARKDN